MAAPPNIISSEVIPSAMASAQQQPATSSQDSRNFLPKEEWETLLQDDGEESVLDRKKKHPRGAFQSSNGKCYRGLYQIGKHLERRWKSQALWGNVLTNPSHVRWSIAEFILTKRLKIKRSSLPPTHIALVKKDAFPKERNYFYVLDQTILVNKFYAEWGPRLNIRAVRNPATTVATNASKIPNSTSPHDRKLPPNYFENNDRMRLFGLLARDENSIDVSDLKMDYEERPPEKPRDENMEETIQYIFERLAEQFNDEAIQISHPDRKEHIPGHEAFNPNDPERIKIPRDEDWIRRCYYDTLAVYQTTVEKWRRAHHAVNESVTEVRRDTERFASYDDKGRNWLSWIYMKDVENHFRFPYHFRNETDLKDKLFRRHSVANLKGNSSNKNNDSEVAGRETNGFSSSLRSPAAEGGAATMNHTDSLPLGAAVTPTTNTLNPTESPTVLMEQLKTLSQTFESGISIAVGRLNEVVDATKTPAAGKTTGDDHSKATLHCDASKDAVEDTVFSQIEKCLNLKRQYEADTSMDESRKRKRLKTLGDYMDTLLERL